MLLSFCLFRIEVCRVHLCICFWFCPLSLYFCLLPSFPTSCCLLISYARRWTEASSTGSGGRLSFVQEGAGFVCSPKARGSVPPGLQNQHRPCGAASLQGLLLQGTGNMKRAYAYTNSTPKSVHNPDALLRALFKNNCNVVYVKLNKKTSVYCCSKNQTHNKWPD